MVKILEMKKKIINNLFLFLITASLTGCTNYHYDETKTIADAGWSYVDKKDFNFEISDTSFIYNIYLEVKHSNTYTAQNVYSKVYVSFPDSKTRDQQVSIELADGKGEWLGKCSGKSCVRRIPFMPNAVFDQIGKYKLSFEQFTRTDNIVGIEKLRLIVEKTKDKKAVTANNKNQQKKVS